MKKSLLIQKRGHHCEKCKLSEWNGFLIPLEKHHINPPSENECDLQLLCANCHAQTKNYRNRKFIVTDEQIIEAVVKSANTTDVLRYIGMTPTNHEIIQQRIASLNLSVPLQKRSKRLGPITERKTTKVTQGVPRNCLKCQKEIPPHRKFCCISCASQFNAKRNAHPPKINWPPADDVLQLVKEIGFISTAKKLNVSDNGIRKFLRRNGLLPQF